MHKLFRNFLLLLLLGFPAHAEDASYRYYIDIADVTLDDLSSLFADLTTDLGDLTPDPLVIVLHDEEAAAFLRSNYRDNKTLVDSAALLDAHGVIDLKMCATWMRNHAVTQSDVHRFIDTVPYGPAEVRRLRDASFTAFSKIKL